MIQFQSFLKLPLKDEVNLSSKEFLFFPETVNKSVRQAAVCVLIYKKDKTYFVGMIKRNAYKGVHSRQIGFAGGKVDSHDSSLWDTAKREVKEEIGINLKDEYLLGKINDVFIEVSNFKVRPFVAFYPKQLQLKLDEREVKHFVELPLNYLFDPKRRENKTITTADKRVINADIINLGNDYIWGASYAILEDFKSRLNFSQ